MAETIEPKRKSEKQEYIYLRDRMKKTEPVLDAVLSLDWLGVLIDLATLASRKLNLLFGRT